MRDRRGRAGPCTAKSTHPLGLTAPTQPWDSSPEPWSALGGDEAKLLLAGRAPRVPRVMPPLTIASLPIAQPSFLQHSLAGQALVGKGLAGAHAGLQATPAVLGAVAPSRPGVPTTWARSRKAPSASVRAQRPGDTRLGRA